MKRADRQKLGILFLILGSALLFFYFKGTGEQTTVALLPTNIPTISPSDTPTRTPTVTWTPQPIIPTRTQMPTATATKVAPTLVHTVEATTAVPTIAATATLFVAPTEIVPPQLPLNRFGLTGGSRNMANAYELGLHGVGFLNWGIAPGLAIGNLPFWHMITTRQWGIEEDLEQVAAVIDAYPGGIWIIGNEPDIMWQDNVTPERYAEIYHEAYYFVKDRDPTARIAIAGVGQPTPLRRAYLDLVLENYQAKYGERLPVDIWTIHAFVLREEAGSWGVGIPPGMEGATGALYTIEQHGDLSILMENLRGFRVWMAERGYRNVPLVITEYAILFPPDYGYPTERVAQFIEDSFWAFASTKDGAVGYPADENRLVQSWFWYSVYDPGEYASSNLYDRETGELTELGKRVRYLLGR